MSAVGCLSSDDIQMVKGVESQSLCYQGTPRMYLFLQSWHRSRNTSIHNSHTISCEAVCMVPDAIPLPAGSPSKSRSLRHKHAPQQTCPAALPSDGRPDRKLLL